MAAAAIGLIQHLDSNRAFGTLLARHGSHCCSGAFLIARRQALKDREPFWSPPTRRVTQALVPPLLAGMCMGGLVLFICPRDIAASGG